MKKDKNSSELNEYKMDYSELTELEKEIYDSAFELRNKLLDKGIDEHIYDCFVKVLDERFLPTKKGIEERDKIFARMVKVYNKEF